MCGSHASEERAEHVREGLGHGELAIRRVQAIALHDVGQRRDVCDAEQVPEDPAAAVMT